MYKYLFQLTPTELCEGNYIFSIRIRVLYKSKGAKDINDENTCMNQCETWYRNAANSRKSMVLPEPQTSIVFWVAVKMSSQ